MYIKIKSMMESNTQKAYSLVLGQCTDLLQSKLKQQYQWDHISSKQDTINILEIIKTVKFRFKYQKFLSLTLCKSKANIYAFRQDGMTNKDYLQGFNNLVDAATVYTRSLNDQAIFDITTKLKHPGVEYSTINTDQNKAVKTASCDLYLATIFIKQSYRPWYDNLSEEPENLSTKGDDDFPDNLVSSYHLISEYKNWQPRGSPPDPSGVAFS